jgi:hypothetical protein
MTRSLSERSSMSSENIEKSCCDQSSDQVQLFGKRLRPGSPGILREIHHSDTRSAGAALAQSSPDSDFETP